MLLMLHALSFGDVPTRRIYSIKHILLQFIFSSTCSTVFYHVTLQNILGLIKYYGWAHTQQLHLNGQAHACTCPYSFNVSLHQGDLQPHKTRTVFKTVGNQYALPFFFINALYSSTQFYITIQLRINRSRLPTKRNSNIKKKRKRQINLSMIP